MKPKNKPLISAEEIKSSITQIARSLDELYAGRELTLVVVLKGAVFFAVDLMRHLKIPTRVEFIRAASYGMRGTKKGALTLSGIDEIDAAGRDLLLVDDIFDTGETLSQIAAQLREKNPRSLESLVLLIKHRARTTTYRPTYSLFTVEDHFVVGYGLDYKEHMRGLCSIYKLEEES